MVFFFAVFNRLIEWLAIAVDSALFVLSTLFLLALAVSMAAHYHGDRARLWWWRLFAFLSETYSGWLLAAMAALGIFRPILPDWAFSSALLIAGLLFAALLWLSFGRLRRVHQLEEFGRIPLVLDHLYEKFIRLLRYPRTLILGLSGLFVLQLVVEAALSLIPNLTGQGPSLYGGTHQATLFSFFGSTGIVSQQLFSLPTGTAVIQGFLYLLSFVGLGVLLLLPVWTWALSFHHRGQGVAVGDLCQWLSEGGGWLNRLGIGMIVTGVPMTIVYLSHRVLVVKELLDQGSTGVSFVPQALAVSGFDGVVWLTLTLVVCAVIGMGFRHETLRKVFIFGMIWTAYGVLLWIYFLPYVEALLHEIGGLLSVVTTQPGIAALISGFLAFFQAVDLLVVYGIGGLATAYLMLPAAAKRGVSQCMKGWQIFRGIFEQAEEPHMLEYYDELRGHFAGNITHHVAHFLNRGHDLGMELPEQIKILDRHGYPIEITASALKMIKW